MERMKQYFARDTLAAHLGIELLEVSPGHARARMQVREHHFNSFGTVHGGAIFSLADFVFAAAANAHGTVAVALNANICFLRPVTSGALTAEGREISLGNKVATYAIEVADEAGRAVAVFQGMVYRKGQPIQAPE